MISQQATVPPSSALHVGVPLKPEVQAEEGIISSEDCGREQFSSALVATSVRVQQVIVSKRPIDIPVELWWKVIDFAADEILWYKNGRTQMRVLARVSRAWYTQCRRRAEERLDVLMRSKKEVYRLIRRLEENPERCGAIKRVHFVNEKINTFGSIAVRMAGKLPQVETLTLSCDRSIHSYFCDWDAGQLHTHVFLHVRVAFESVTTLDLFEVRFPSAMVFGRLVCALPRLTSLTCELVEFKQPSVAPSPGPSLLRLGAVNLADSPHIVDFLLETRAGAFLRHITYSGSVEACSRLVAVAAPSLSSLHFTPARYKFQVNHDPESSPDLLPDLMPAQALCVLSVSLSPYSKFDPRQLASALPRASLPNLREIEITAWVSVNVKFDALDSESYAQIDKVFSGRQFPLLRKVTFHLRCEVALSKVMDVISAVTWRTHLSSKIPLLHASGRLLAPVSVVVREKREYEEYEHDFSS
ncbi:uncharacterized protein FIBRA_01904 [Fibroporia radiculosa]|uniref:F-box domain-containing protein n=1 Tax=Fibroporia radiculosa TaxID=599839 RepID=J4H1I6_9APHY|nr:uncharacterized protein FIBRA_01904 [Fibroporia radiculosa]CCL99879.1 predicted protein [Fibroporia radiculosa]